MRIEIALEFQAVPIRFLSLEIEFPILVVPTLKLTCRYEAPAK